MPPARTRAPRTPLWVRGIVAAIVIGGPLAWLVQWHGRVVNEHRLGAIASQIAGRHVTVHCPGMIGRALRYDIVEGTVQFDAQGRPADETKLRAFPCAELDALAEGRRAGVLACVARAGDCGKAEDDLAVAIDVLTHESFHLAGYADEAAAECHSLQTMAWTAQQLRVAPEVARRLAAWQATHAYLQMPSQYRGACDLSGQAGPSPGR
ncbi:MAG TPA: hypothetical protein VH276_09695 [Solirubrobacteraceae bacterium]|nr:hypothetical protein [Solirubrobacteraceae bacterium]